MVAVPYCRCRVLYIGSAVPTVTKDGLQGIQQPLRERYPTEENADTRGIDSWLSVWSNGILLEYIEGDKKTETAFHPINSLHYCAAVRYVNVTGYAIEGGGERFLPLDSPFACNEDSPHPPIFAAIFRRTTGIKVLECHAFICTNSKAANALVRCCFHAYAESMYVKLDEKIPGLKAIKEASRSSTPNSPTSELEDLPTLVDEREQKWTERTIGKETWERRQQSGEYDTASISSSIVNRYRSKKRDQECAQSERGALVPYSRPEARRAGSDGDLPYSQAAIMGYHPGIPISYRPPLGLMPPPRFMPPSPMMRPPLVPMPPPFPPHMMPPPPPIHMMPLPPPSIGIPPRFPPGMFPPPPMRMMPPPHFLRPYGPLSPQLGRPRTPNDGPIITGPESVYGTLPRVSAYEEPLYMQGNLPYMSPQASYQPSNYPPEQYDAYYDTYKRQRSPPTKEKSIGSQTSSKREDLEQDEASQFWDAYETGIYKKPYLNEKAFFATIRSSSAGVNESVTVNEVEPPRPETPPADYEAAFEGMHISNKQTQQRTTAVMY